MKQTAKKHGIFDQNFCYRKKSIIIYVRQTADQKPLFNQGNFNLITFHSAKLFDIYDMLF